MAGTPKKPEEIFEPFCADFETVYGPDLLAVLVYGSCARGEYLPGTSDINFMVLLSEAGIAQLEKSLKTVKKWRRRAVATPLMLTRAYIETSLDTFPIEFLNIQSAYRMLRGEDPLKDLVFERRMLRLQCERELKGKLLQLREHFLETGGSARLIRQLIERSLPTFFSIFRAVVFLHDRPIPLFRDRLLEDMHAVIGLDRELFARLCAVRDTTEKLSAPDALVVMQNYINEIRRLALAVDSLTDTAGTASVRPGFI